MLQVKAISPLEARVSERDSGRTEPERWGLRLFVRSCLTDCEGRLSSPMAFFVGKDVGYSR
jgi:hypothetical protein